MSLENLINDAAEVLPEGWIVRIEVEKGAGWVKVIRPDGTEVEIEDDECDMAEMFQDAVGMVMDEVAMDRIIESEEYIFDSGDQEADKNAVK